MSDEVRSQERLARQRIEEERLARPITHLSKLQKMVLIGVSKATPQEPFLVGPNSPEAAALESLAALGLVKLICTKACNSGLMLEKGRLLLHENPKLKFPASENTRWIVSTIISGVAVLIAIGSMIISILSLQR